MRKRKQAVPNEHCAHCRRWLPADHVCPSKNKANAARGLRPVFAVRMPTKMREQLDALAAKRMARQSWPRVTAASLVVEAVARLLAEVEADE